MLCAKLLFPSCDRELSLCGCVCALEVVLASQRRNLLESECEVENTKLLRQKWRAEVVVTTRAQTSP